MTLFDPQALELAVQRTLESSPDVPENARGACVVVANQDGVKAVLAVRIHGGWKVESSVSHGWHDDDSLEYGVSIRGTW